MNVHVYYSTAATFRDAIMGPEFCQKHGLVVEHELVATIEIDGSGDPETIAERAWSAMNRHEAPDQAPELDAKQLRSMSVGDIVKLDGVGLLRAESFGFSRIESFMIAGAS